MMLDAQNFFTENTSTYDGSQTLTGGTAVVSYNAIDAGVGAAATTPTRQLGAGQPLYFCTQIVTKDTGHTTPTLNIKLVGATDAAFTSSLIIVQTGTIANATLSDGMWICLPVPVMTAYRYYRAEYTLGNADNSFVVKSFLSDIAPSPLYMPLPAGMA